jgi:hypothetical protein
MTPNRLLGIIAAAHAELTAFGIADTVQARVMSLAIALQESRISRRRQVGASGLEDGPAVSFWQFEKGGGVRGVLTHPVAAPIMRKVCDAYNVESTEQGLWDAMRYNDTVAAIAARLLFYVLPNPLPTSAATGWEQYLKAWRPGKPKPDTWPDNWARADLTVKTP